MTFIIRRAEPSDWEVYRSIRLRSLSEEPDAYEAEYEAEARFEPDRWKARLATATSFLETGRRRLLDRDSSVTEIEFAYPRPT